MSKISARKKSVSEKLALRLIHEINNPLSVISARTELLLLEAKKGGNLARSLKIIQEQVQRIENISRNVAFHSRLPRLNPREVNVNNIIKELACPLKKEADFKNIKLEVLLNPKIKNIPCDEKLLRHAILNLCQIGLQAVKQGGTFRIQAKRGGESLKINFEPFFTLKAGVAEQNLAVAKKIILKHKGAIALKSRTGKPGALTISLPIA